MLITNNCKPDVSQCCIYKLFNCGSKHSKSQCKAFGHVCRNCGRSRHVESVCMSKSEKCSPNKQPQHNQGMVTRTNILPINSMERRVFTNIRKLVLRKIMNNPTPMMSLIL